MALTRFLFLRHRQKVVISQRWLEADGRFSTLLAAVGAADLVGAVTGDDDLTILAPTNQAFANLPESLLTDL